MRASSPPLTRSIHDRDESDAFLSPTVDPTSLRAVRDAMSMKPLGIGAEARARGAEAMRRLSAESS
jgi:hypothetical protein